ncbi:hypothetical protein KR222_009848, partial [Zaprionus bogoriensis]
IFTGARTEIRQLTGIPNDFYPQQLFQQIGSKYYYIAKTKKVSWYSAAHTCHTIGGHLIHLPDKATFLEINAKFKNATSPHYWVDLSDHSDPGHVVSMTTGFKPDYVEWCEKQDTILNIPRNCVHIENSEKPCMQLVPCHDLHSYVCEASIPRTITIVVS